MPVPKQKLRKQARREISNMTSPVEQKPLQCSFDRVGKRGDVRVQFLVRGAIGPVKRQRQHQTFHTAPSYLMVSLPLTKSSQYRQTL